VRVFYSDHYTIPLPKGHRFPMEKYRLLREGLLEQGILGEGELYDPGCADINDILLAHSRRYVDGIVSGSLQPLEMRRIGFPWSPDLVVRSLATVGGCIAAALAALDDGISGNLAGGTHHAMTDAGEGFCVFNDVAVTIRRMQRDGVARTFAIVDLDVHQGNGNSEILGGDANVTIMSMHGAKNYPFRKVPSTIDIDLPDGTTDDVYLRELSNVLPAVLDRRPDVVFYQCGVDPLESDSLGRLSLTYKGLSERDRLVLQGCKDRNIPVVLNLGGGYANPITDTIQAQCNTYRVVRSIFPGV
jgi:acetoin utilization deacetylase AcuC-like enzyme